VDADLVSAQAMNCSLDIIIVHWNAGGHLRDCLASIAGTRAGPEIRRVTLVDNASSDGSLCGLEDLAVPLKIIRNEQNVGFAAACNPGCCEQHGRLLALPQSRYAAVSGHAGDSDTFHAERTGERDRNLRRPDGRQRRDTEALVRPVSKPAGALQRDDRPASRPVATIPEPPIHRSRDRKEPVR
jgi:hypothetical protein